MSQFELSKEEYDVIITMRVGGLKQVVIDYVLACDCLDVFHLQELINQEAKECF